MAVKKTLSEAERRQAVRANRVIAVKHRLFKRGVKKPVLSWSLSTTKNMSATGLLFLSDVPYKTGDIVDISVVMSGVIDVLKGHAQVVRVAENGNTAFDVAVKFLESKKKGRSAKSHY